MGYADVLSQFGLRKPEGRTEAADVVHAQILELLSYQVKRTSNHIARQILACLFTIEPMATVEKRPLTEEEIAERDRLVDAWERYKATHPGASQIWLSRATGLGTQGLISQYLRGIIPLNVRALLAICAQIGANPADISPRLAKDVQSIHDSAGLDGLSDAARKVIDAVIRADRAGEPPETFKYILRLLPNDEEPLGRLNV